MFVLDSVLVHNPSWYQIAFVYRSLSVLFVFVNVMWRWWSLPRPKTRLVVMCIIGIDFFCSDVCGLWTKLLFYIFYTFQDWVFGSEMATYAQFGYGYPTASQVLYKRYCTLVVGIKQGKVHSIEDEIIFDLLKINCDTIFITFYVNNITN